MKKYIVLLSLLIFLFPALDLIADDNTNPKVSIKETNININFPSDITFNITGSSTEQIESINLLFKDIFESKFCTIIHLCSKYLLYFLTKSILKFKSFSSPVLTVQIVKLSFIFF